MITVYRYQDVLCLVRDFGSVWTLEKYGEGTYDPITGTTNAGKLSEVNFLGYRYNYKADDIDGTNILMEDFKLLVPYVDVDGEILPFPETNDKVVRSGITQTVVSVHSIEYRDDPVCWQIQVRE